jgi:hypothetical protein
VDTHQVRRREGETWHIGDVYLALASGGILAAVMIGSARAGAPSPRWCQRMSRSTSSSPHRRERFFHPSHRHLYRPGRSCSPATKRCCTSSTPQADTTVPRLGADFIEQVPRIEAPGEFAAVVYVMEDWNEDHAIRNEAMNLLWRSQDEPFAVRVLALLDRPFESERMRAFLCSTWALFYHKRPTPSADASAMRLVAAVRDRHLAVRREAVSALAEIRDPTVSAALERGPETAEWDGMHDLAIHLCHRLNLRQHVVAIRALALANDQEVRIAALYVLGQWRDQESRRMMEAAATSSVFSLRRAGEMALTRLAEPPREPTRNF